MGGFVGALTGDDAADASKDAANIQAQSAAAARKQQERFLEKIRGDLAPFRSAGANNLTGLNRLIRNPQAQLDFIQNNPFFAALADDAQNRLMNVQAASGRLGTGDTPAALQNQLLLLGNDLLQQSIGNRFNMATMGQNAAAQTGTMTQQAGNNISELITGQGNALAGGQVGAANAKAQGSNNLMGMGAGAGAAYMMGMNPLMGILLSDRRFKTDVEVLGELDCGIPVCRWRYPWSNQYVIGPMAQDVQKVVPGAVLDVFGVLYVDFDELNRVLH